MIAYYCFVNLGWSPSQYDALPYQERVLIAEFVNLEMKSREKPTKGGIVHGGNTGRTETGG